MVSTVLVFLGGLGLFMYGVQTTSDALQKFAAHRLKQILQSLTKKTFMAVLLGMVMTVAFQSSAATTVLVVEFVNVGMMNLGQALGIVLGSAVGTSISIQLIAFQIFDVALGAIFIGFILYFAGKKQWKHLGHSLIGFGLIFVGMSNMSNASAPLRNIPEVYTFLSQLGTQPFLAIIVGLILTTVLQSSTAVFAIMMSLAGQRLLGLSAIVPLVLGAHIGGTVTTLLTSLTAQKMDAKRTAIANTGYKVVAAVLVYPFLTQYAHLIQWTTGNLQNRVAFKEALRENMIVPAIKHLEDLPEVLSIPWVSVAILIGGDINDLEGVLKVRSRFPEKYLLAHVDLIEGVGKDEAGMRYLKRLGLDGVVSVKWQLLRYAKENKLLTVQRLFLVDSEAIRTGLKVIKKVTPDAIEILPATVPKFAIDEFHKVTDLSILGGGLLRTEEDVRTALSNGLTAVTASRRNLWKLRLT